jgi:hypothetical protein
MTGFRLPRSETIGLDALGVALKYRVLGSTGERK